MFGLGQTMAQALQMVGATASTAELFSRAMNATGMSERQLKAVTGAVATAAARNAAQGMAFGGAARRIAVGNAAGLKAVRDVLSLLAAGGGRAGAMVYGAIVPGTAASVAGIGNYVEDDGSEG